MKFLIAGLGSIGRRHFRNLLALGEKDIILYRTRRSTLPDDELAGYPTETSLEAALAHQPEAVIIANPTALHLDVAIPAARAGCHLMIEKPIAHALERVDELRNAVQQGGGQVLVGFHFRYHPGLQQAAVWLQAGVIGRVLSARAHWGEYLPGWHPWEDYRQGYSARADLGGGVILTLSHPFDYLRWLVGDVQALWAFAGRVGDLDVEVEDTAEIGLQFQGGALGSLHLDYNQQPPAHYLEVSGTQGTLRWDNSSGAVSVFAPGQPTGASQTVIPPAGFERNDLFQAEMRHFIEVVRGETQPVCRLEDGVQALHLAMAAHQSARYGQVVRFGAGEGARSNEWNV